MFPTRPVLTAVAAIVLALEGCSSSDNVPANEPSSGDAQAEDTSVAEDASAEPDAPDDAATEPALDADVADTLDAADAREYGQCGNLIYSSCLGDLCGLQPSCFVMGSPTSEWGRNADDEAQVEMWIDHFFYVQSHEVTRAEWTAAGLALPDVADSDGGTLSLCTDPQCPVTGVTWYEALFYADLLSTTSKCFELSGCTGEPGTGMVCDTVELKKTSMFDCYGFRLLTSAEWEYAARAHKTTAFYTGDITPGDPDGGCSSDLKLDPAAWYCSNAGSPPSVHAIKSKSANLWELFDMLGNASEWVGDNYQPNQGPGPMSDPGGLLDATGPGQVRGGNAASLPRGCRAAAHEQMTKSTRNPGVGFRLARTFKPLT
jgi:formylglycine-generating enzyme required for sulfatase activity